MPKKIVGEEIPRQDFIGSSLYFLLDIPDVGKSSNPQTRAVARLQ